MEIVASSGVTILKQPLLELESGEYRNAMARIDQSTYQPVDTVHEHTDHSKRVEDQTSGVCLVTVCLFQRSHLVEGIRNVDQGEFLFF